MRVGKKIAILVALLALCVGVPVALLLAHRPHVRIEKIVGVGVALRTDNAGHAIIIAGVLSNTPAAEAGITQGWIVTKVDDISIEGKNLHDTVQLLRGPVGTKVELELASPDGASTNTFDLARKEIKISVPTDKVKAIP